MAQGEIEVNIPEVVFGLNAIAQKQIPFALSVAINETLAEAQKAVRQELPRRFTIRNKWVAKGIVIQRSTKQKAVGSIGSRDEFMALQEFGGQKRARGGRIAIPTRALKSRTRAGIVRKRLRPRQILKRKKVFVGETRKGTGAIFERKGTASASRLIPLYFFIESARVRRRFGFERTVEKTVARRWEKNFGKALAKAIATAK